MMRPQQAVHPAVHPAVQRKHLVRRPLYPRRAPPRQQAPACRGFPPAEASTKRAKRPKLTLSIASREESVIPEMGRITKHPELQKFADLVQSIPKEGTVEHRTLMLVDAIQQCGIKAVAIDFDYTITTKHTGGGWPTPRLSELTLSTDAVHLAKELNKRSIPLCVVTFSDPADTMPFLERVGGEALVRGVLRENNDPFVVDSVVAMRPDLNTDPTKFKALGLEHPPPRNKSYHIDVVARKHNILATEVILIDDDRINCAQHFKAGGLALYVTGEGFSLDNIIPVTSASLLS